MFEGNTTFVTLACNLVGAVTLKASSSRCTATLHGASMNGKLNAGLIHGVIEDTLPFSPFVSVADDTVNPVKLGIIKDIHGRQLLAVPCYTNISHVRDGWSLSGILCHKKGLKFKQNQDSQSGM